MPDSDRGGEGALNRKVKLDAIDRRILRNLRDEGRITNVELARRAGISAPPCLRRVRALESAGYITGYHAELEAEQLHHAPGDKNRESGKGMSVALCVPHGHVHQSGSQYENGRDHRADCDDTEDSGHR